MSRALTTLLIITLCFAFVSTIGVTNIACTATPPASNNIDGGNGGTGDGPDGGGTSGGDDDDAVGDDDDTTGDDDDMTGDDDDDDADLGECEGVCCGCMDANVRSGCMGAFRGCEAIEDAEGRATCFDTLTSTYLSLCSS